MRFSSSHLLRAALLGFRFGLLFFVDIAEARLPVDLELGSAALVALARRLLE